MTFRERHRAPPAQLSGAEAVGQILRFAGVRTLFAYPGTSELALCAAIDGLSDVSLVSARGDREAAFMAGGASWLRPATSAAILHGARGSTNACGAIADLRRNEIGALLLVGLPSTRSARFLPPHGEERLIEGLGTFAKHAVRIGAPSRRSRETAARRLVRALTAAIALARTPPAGPTLVGIPQDVLENRWVPQDALDEPARHVSAPPKASELDDAYKTLAHARRCVILADDYLLRDRGAVAILDEFAALLDARVFQVRYRRGPMLFERLSPRAVPSFAGWYDPDDPTHRQLFAEADVLVTLEDRNAYPRVVGDLPACAKVAFTSDAAKTRKNGYLSEEDVVVVGVVGDLLRILVQRLRVRHRSTHELPVSLLERARAVGAVPRRRDAPVRDAIGAELGCHFRAMRNPVLVDDSQMFGGLLAEVYDAFPDDLRIFGGHGGFVGAGIAYATGLALNEPDTSVTCAIGDQSLTNGLQALIATGEQRARVVYVVCNNGESVSLHKEFAELTRDDRLPPWLRNAPNLKYTPLARAFGIPAATVDWTTCVDEDGVARAARELRAELKHARETGGPTLVEILLPALGPTWDGIWITKGFDERPPIDTSSVRRPAQVHPRVRRPGPSFPGP
jgi:acetolactate synthase I/II/III large subunit